MEQDPTLQHLLHLSAQLQEALQRLAVRHAPTEEPLPHPAPVPAAGRPPICKAWQQFLRLLCDPRGYSYKEIAAKQGVHPSTLRTYRERISKRFGVRGKAALVAWAVKNGWG
ncbi:MAG: helix-turn-helix transcriptional regulator [Flavobacteriales bacterium]|nr:helix-turn-helix transcriptional regulator [Flavobacteriales bacterium]